MYDIDIMEYIARRPILNLLHISKQFHKPVNDHKAKRRRDPNFLDKDLFLHIFNQLHMTTITRTSITSPCP